MPSLDIRNAGLSFTAFWKLNLYLSTKTENSRKSLSKTSSWKCLSFYVRAIYQKTRHLVSVC